MRAALLTLLLALCVPLPAGQAAAAPPRRVVSLNLLLDQWVMLLADEGQVAALTELSRSPNYSPLFEKARRLPAIRGTAEEVLRRKPDLVLAGRWGASETVALLEKCGVPVRVFDYPENFDGIAEQARQLAALLGHPERGEAFARDLRARLEKVRASRPAVPPRVLELGQNGWTSGSGTMLDLLLREAGCRNLAAERGIHWLGQVSIEELVLMRPGRLVTPSNNHGAPSLANAFLASAFLKRVAGGRPPVFLPNGTLDAGGPFTIDALECLSAALRE